MESKNETHTEIVNEMRRANVLYGANDSHRPMTRFEKALLQLYADRFEVAHKREMEHQAVHNCELRAKSGLCGLKDEIKAHRREVAEMRECLKEATNHICANCGKDYDGKCDNCMIKNKWRKALEGGEKDEGK